MPTGLSVTPADTRSNPATITVKDLGNAPVHVSTSTLLLHAHCAMTTTAGITVSPASFTLNPEGTRKVTVHVPGTRGDFGVLFSAHPLHPAPGADIALGAIGAQVLQGHATDCAHPHAAPESSNSFPSMLILMIVLISLALGLATWGIILRRNHQRRTT